MSIFESLVYAAAHPSIGWPILVLVMCFALAITLAVRSKGGPEVALSREGIHVASGFVMRFLGSSHSPIPWNEIVGAAVGRDDGDYPVLIALRSGEVRRITGFWKKQAATSFAAEVTRCLGNPAARASLPAPSSVSRPSGPLS